MSVRTLKFFKGNAGPPGPKGIEGPQGQKGNNGNPGDRGYKGEKYTYNFSIVYASHFSEIVTNLFYNIYRSNGRERCYR